MGTLQKLTLIGPRLRVSRAIVLILVFLAGGIAGCTVSRNPVSGDRRLYGYSWERELEIGRIADRQITAQYGVYEDSVLAAYVERIGRDVLAHSHMRGPEVDPRFRETPFTFRVLDSPVVNAFALPGGYVYLTRGLLAYLENEAQLAVVLGHEIGHVAARHASQQALSQRFGQIGVLGGAILGQEMLGLPAGDLLQLGQAATQLLFLSYGRDDERESDRLGVQYARAAGYRAEEGAGFFSVLQRMGENRGEELPTFLSTHPDPGDRGERIRKLAAQGPAGGDSLAVGRAGYLRRVEGIAWGENPREGFRVEGWYVHPNEGYQVPIPTGWSYARSPAGATFRQPEDRAVVTVDRLRDATDVVSAARAFLSGAQIRARALKEETVGGRPAAVASGAVSAEGSTYRVLAVFVEWRGREEGRPVRVVRLLGLTGAELYATYRSAFDRVLYGLEAITDPERLEIQPARVRLWEIDREGPFGEVIQADGSALSTGELAILNQREEDEIVPSGTRVKVPIAP